MKKAWMMIPLCILVLFFAFGCALAEEEGKLHSDEELAAFLEDCRAAELKEFTVEMSREYFDSLDAKYYAKMDILMLKAGIRDKKVEMQTLGTFKVAQVVWGYTDWAECAGLDDAERAVSELLGKKVSSFSLICSPELFEEFYSGKSLYRFAAREGAAVIQYSFLYSSCIVNVEKISYMEYGHAAVADEEEFLAAISGFAGSNASGFYIVCPQDFMDRVLDGLEYRRNLLAKSPLDQYQLQYNSLYSWFLFSGVSYTSVPRLACGSEEAIVSAIRQMGIAGADTFDLILPGDLFENVKKDLFTRLHKLEGDAGMSSCKMDYDITSRVLHYSGAVIAADIVRLATVAEAGDYLSSQLAAGEKEIVLFLSDALYDRLMDGVSSFTIANDSMALFYDLAANAGIFDYSFSYSPTSRVVQLHVKSCYPGTEIIRAVRSGREDSLSGRLQDTYERALAIAEQCTAADQTETARNIHDYLCRTVVYTIDEQSDEDDTAIGAILNGEANCDGYADAFYLIASLSGIDTRYQHGDSYDIGTGMKDFRNSVTHLWNLIRIDGTWRLVDVTWDDREQEGEEGEGISYTWFNIGKDRASRMHIWNEETSVALQPETDLTCRPDNEYLIVSPEDGEKAVQDAMDRSRASFELIFADAACAEVHDRLLDLICEKAPSGVRYAWNELMLTLTVFPGG